MYNNTTGNDNTSIGYQSLYTNTTASFNTAIGSSSLYANTTGTNNTAIGHQSLNKNTIGKNNIGLGHQTLFNHLINDNNIAIGTTSLYNNTTGNDNTAIGYQTLYNTTVGNNNVAIGNASLQNIITGTNNVGIGYGAGPSGDFTNTICIGTTALTTTSNTTVIGNSSTTSFTYFGTIAQGSDARLKTNFQPLDVGMNFIEHLNPMYYNWKINGRKDIGFTAQDLLEIQNNIGINVPNLVNTDDPDFYTVSYTQLIPVLVKTIKEINTQIQELRTEVDMLKNKN